MNNSAESYSLFCENHPTVGTSLRCNRCNKPICTRCAVLTPTGYRCKECVRGQQKVFETATGFDPLIALVVAAPLAFLGSLFLPRFILFALLLSPVAGGLIAEAVRLAVKRRRSKQLFLFAALGAALGALPMAGLEVFRSFGWMISIGVFNFSILWPLVGHVLYIFMVTTTTYYRLSGINIRG